MIYAHRSNLLPLCFLLLITACDKQCDLECDNFDDIQYIAFLNEGGEDLLGSVSTDSMKITNLRSLNTPDREFTYEYKRNIGGSFPARVNLLDITMSDLYIVDGSTSQLERKHWILEYERSGVAFQDTIGITPVDLSTKCCTSLSVQDFSYTGTRVVSYMIEEGFPIYSVVLRSM